MFDMCIYHGNCADGFAAAWVVWKFHNKNAEFVKGIYGQSPPDVTGKRIVLVDFSYKRGVLVEMASKATHILVLDHHKSAEADLQDLPDNVKVYFNMKYSGAMISWKYFKGGKPPTLINHIQDRDLWSFNLDGTKEIQAAVFARPYEFDVWNKMMSMSVEELRKEGEILLKNHHKNIDEFIETTAHELEIGGFKVPAFNGPYQWGSDGAHKLCHGVPFAAYYYFTNNGNVIFGLRSEEDGEDVSKIAASYGGGGHEHAAGFTTTREDLMSMMST